MSGLAGVYLPAVAFAQGFFLPATDYRLREDLGLLIDEGVVDLPQNTWPLPAADARAAISRVRAENIDSEALRSALARVASRATPRDTAEEWRLQEVSLIAGEPGLLRDEATLGRENFEIHSRGGATTERWSLTLAATAIGSPDDGKHLRADGSELTFRAGNWLLSLNQFDRWWGPGHGGGLILSTNARPMPGVSLDRIRSAPFDFPILRWLGPWRFSGFVSAMEQERADVDHPLFMGMRFSFKPVPIMELGLSRTAQFCGQNELGTRPKCNLSQFRRVLTGADNKEIRVDPMLEPGNQMAGFDMRLVSPFRPLPVALYAEMTGEDNSSTGIPERYLALFGAEGWWLQDSGNIWRARLEYANTSCKWYAPMDNSDCSYRQTIFHAGYRYRERNIGHTTDADSESTTLQLSMTHADGSRWSMALRHATLDRYGAPDSSNPLTVGRSDYDSLELGWDGWVVDQPVSVQLGYERQDGNIPRKGVFGFIQWRKSL